MGKKRTLPLFRMGNRDLESFAGDPQLGFLTLAPLGAVTLLSGSKPSQAVEEILWGKVVSLALLKSHLGKQLPPGPRC